MDIALIEESLGYVFTDKVWLQQALTHPSYSQRRAAGLAYERLEYLGDAVLELVVSRELFTQFPQSDEGELTKLRSGIVSRQHLAGLCRELGWCEQMNMSPQLEKTGGRTTMSIMANTFESVIGAVMMDSNYNAARKVALRLMQTSITNARQYMDVNYKGALLEILQSIDNTPPVYTVEPADPKHPEGPFCGHALWHGRELGSAVAPSKHKAEMAAAAAALQAKIWLKKA